MAEAGWLMYLRSSGTTNQLYLRSEGQSGRRLRREIYDKATYLHILQGSEALHEAFGFNGAIR